MKLRREIRCFPAAARGGGTASANSWAGSPYPDGAAAFWSLQAMVQGVPDTQTGYLCDIRRLDDMLRNVVAGALYDRVIGFSRGSLSVAKALAEVFALAADQVVPECTLSTLRLAVSPFLWFEVNAGDTKMVSVTQSFEFSASHRLYCEALSAEENRRIFGKCCNPNGHGHNYILEITIRGEPDPITGTIVELPRFEQTVRETVIDRFDHKHLNLDCREFEELNPSVENIARVVWKRLEGAFSPATLSLVRLWETPKTCAEYAGDD